MIEKIVNIPTVASEVAVAALASYHKQQKVPAVDDTWNKTKNRIYASKCFVFIRISLKILQLLFYHIFTEKQKEISKRVY